MNLKKSLAVIFSVLLVVSLSSCQKKTGKAGGAAAGNDMVGEAEGYATIFDNDDALAKDRAIDDAMNKLVKMKLGTSVEGKSVVEDFALVESIVEAKSSGMVKNWSIVKQNKSEGTYFVTIKGEVYAAAVNAAIESTLKNYGRPRFMILIKEKFEGKNNMPGFTVTELSMMEIMDKAGFEFVDAKMTLELLKREKRKMKKAIDGKVGDDVQQLLLDGAGAEVIIIGTAKTMDQSGVMRKFGSADMKSKQAILNLKAIDVYTGRVLASTSANAPGIHIEPETASKMAIQNCLRKILGGPDDDEGGKFKSGPFMNQITKKFLQSATGRMIMMNIAGLNFTDLTKFRNEVQNRIRGVKKIYTRGQSGKYSKIEVEFAGKTQDLAQELNSKAEKLGFAIEIKEQKPNKIMLTAKRTK